MAVAHVTLDNEHGHLTYLDIKYGKKDTIGEIIGGGPFQGEIWRTTRVRLSSIKAGQKLVFQVGHEWRHLNYPIVHVSRRKK
jgi:hypothetical protein